MTSKPEPSARRLLLVEDSVSFGYLVKTKLENKTDLDIILAGSLADAKRAVEIYNGDFFLGLLDLNLPDASGEEVFSLAKTHNIPSLVFSGSFSEDLRTKLFAAGAIDYIGKDSPHSVEYMISMIERLLANESTGAMIVDDSTSARMQIGSMLRQYRFDVHEAHDGVEAMEILEKVPNIRLVITDYNMPNMDGHELTKRIRQKFAPDRVAVIGLSAQGTTTVTAKFLKAGANDFLSKPF